MNAKRIFYYEFWIQSSRGTDATIIRHWKEKPDKAELKEFAELWIDGFGAVHVSENHVSYGWRPLPQSSLPKNRSEALKQHQKLCKIADTWNRRRNRITKLLAVYPFNGATKP